MILLLVDVQNLFYSVRDNFDTDARVDFKKLLEIATNNRDEAILAQAFIAQYGPNQDKSVVGALKAVGYEVHVKQVKIRKGKYTRTDLDSDMILVAMDVVTKNPKVKTVVVASGDSDFVPLYDKLKERDIRVEVLGFQDSMSTELQHCVDSIRLLGKTILFDSGEVSSHARSTEDSPAQRRNNDSSG
ncbi:MAG: NYN domain-containing protein [Candidatus Thorarchaeota archaeon]|jgi:uncharacterized LabA/DUF88 family protein